MYIYIKRNIKRYVICAIVTFAIRPVIRSHTTPIYTPLVRNFCICLAKAIQRCQYKQFKDAEISYQGFTQSRP